MIGSNIIAVMALMAGASYAFAPSVHLSTSAQIQSSTVLCGTKRRGKLAGNIKLNEEGKISKIMTKKEKQKLGSSKMKRGKNEAEISPLLAEWANSDDDSESSGGSTDSVSAASASVFTPFDDEDTSKSKNKRRNSNDSPVTLIDNEKIDEILGTIEEMLSTPNCDIPKLLAQISALIDMQPTQTIPALKSLITKKSGKDENQTNYRLAWAGSDKAICHIGTALHKVPLARLEEMFLCLGYNRWELLEVIRVLGPFPNVRNTLKGGVKVMMGKGSGFSGGSAVVPSRDGSGREAVRMNISYSSMIDGTGKEILAGKDANVKYVDLDVWFASEKAVVATIVEEFNEDSSGDPLTSSNGEKVLLFVAEENLEESLEKLRAA